MSTPKIEEPERIVFARCDECPRPGHFHGKACWVFAEQAERTADAALSLPRALGRENEKP